MSQFNCDRYVTIKDCAELFSVSKTTIRNWMNAGAFPQPYKIGRIIRWKKSEIENFEPNATKD